MEKAPNQNNEQRMTNELAEKVLPSLPIERFTSEKSGRAIEYEQSRLMQGKFLGWTHARGELTRADCNYVCMFEGDNGQEYWCHIGESTFRNIARKESGIDL